MTKNYDEHIAFLRNSDQSQVIAKQIVKSLELNFKFYRYQQAPFQIFDIGCGDGTFTFLYLKFLNKLVSVIQLTAIEPETPAYNVFTQRIVEKNYTWVTHQNISLQEFLKSTASKSSLYDFVLFAHCFYHFPKEEWEPILDGSIRLLRAGGLISIINDSHQGEAYKLKDRITRGKPDTLEFGDLHSAEDIEYLLNERGIKYGESSFPVCLYVKDDKQKLESLARHLAFLYRTFPEKILANYRDDLEQMLAESRKAGSYYKIENIVKIIAFGKPSPRK